MPSETPLTNISTHSPLEIASLTAISTWLTKDSPTQHVGRNLTWYFWNLFFRYWLPSVIPSRGSASYSETSKSRINTCSCIAVIFVKWLKYYCFYSNPKVKKQNFSQASGKKNLHIALASFPCTFTLKVPSYRCTHSVWRIHQPKPSGIWNKCQEQTNFLECCQIYGLQGTAY